MARTVLGLDIGSQTIKYVEVKKAGKLPQLLSYGILPAPSRGILSESSIDQQAVVETIKKLLHDGGVKTKEATLALPEAKVFTRVIEVPVLSEKELANSIQWEAEQYIPLRLEEVFMDFSILREVTNKEGIKKLEVLLIAAPKGLVAKYQSITELSGLTPIALETDILSASRALVPGGAQAPAVMVMNIGASTTSFAILRGGVIALTRAIEIGGTTMMRAIAQEFGFEPLQAEEYKKTYGLDQSKLEGKVYKALSGVYLTILEEVKRAFSFYKEKYPNEYVTSVILAGSVAHLPGLVQGFARELAVEVQIGNPWTKIIVDPTRFPHALEHAVTLCVACGLTLRQD